MTDARDMFEMMRTLRRQTAFQPIPPAGLIESRVMELERMGLEDIDEAPGELNSVRQLAIASLLGEKSSFFITADDEILDRREALENRFGLTILSVQEAFMLLRESSDPPN